MGYKVTKDGEIVCDTAEEALTLSRAMSSGTDLPHRNSDHPGGVDSGRWNESRYREFMSFLRGHQKPFLDLLLSNPHGKTDRAIRQALGLETNMALAGVISGLAKNARKVGSSVDEIFTKKKMHLGEERVLEYMVTDTFRSIAAQVGHSKEK